MSGLGTWAEGALKAVVDAAGLEPANLNALKLAVLNTGHVAGADDGAFAVRFRQVKANALSASEAAGAVSSLASGIPGAVSQAVADLEVTIAEIEFPVGGVVIPVKVSLPESASEAAGGYVEQCIAAVEGVVGLVTGVKEWR